MTVIIETKGLTKEYGKAVALNNLTISIKKGEILGYLGPNGAGKTTTIRLLLGLIKPTRGEALLFGQHASADPAALHKRIAYIPGETSYWPNMTGAEILRFLANIHGSTDNKYQEELIEKFEFDPNKKVRSYSKGNRQKIALIAALASRAELLILDEPTSGLDPVMAKVFRNEIIAAKQNGQTIFLSSHILEEVEALCDRVGVLRRGKLVELGTLSELRHLAAFTVEATFADAPPDISRIENVSDIEITGNHLKCTVSGSINALLQIITKARPESFLSRKPSLEELFLALYDEDEK